MRDEGSTGARQKQAQSLEQRISSLELELGLSDIKSPDEEPITLGELTRYIKQFWANTRNFILAKLRLPERQNTNYRMS
jgi:hypothetical protein